MPLSILTVPWLGELILRTPFSRSAYRAVLVQGLGASAAAATPLALLDVLRLAQARPGNARTVARLMHAPNGFRRPRPETVMAEAELRRITASTLFVWGRQDPYLGPRAAAPWIGQLASATLREVPGGHAPWLDDADACARLVDQHLAATGVSAADAATADLADSGLSRCGCAGAPLGCHSAPDGRVLDLAGDVKCVFLWDHPGARHRPE